MYVYTYIHGVNPCVYTRVHTRTPLSLHLLLEEVPRYIYVNTSVTQTNPWHGPGWIAAARLEEVHIYIYIYIYIYI